MMQFITVEEELSWGLGLGLVRIGKLVYFLFLFVVFLNCPEVKTVEIELSYCHLVAAFGTSTGTRSACDVVHIHTCKGVSYLPVGSFTSWMIRGLRVTIPVPRGRKSLLWRKKRFAEGLHTHAHARKETHNFPALSGKLASFVCSMSELQLKTSRALRHSDVLGSFLFFPKINFSSK